MRMTRLYAPLLLHPHSDEYAPPTRTQKRRTLRRGRRSPPHTPAEIARIRERHDALRAHYAGAHPWYAARLTPPR